MIAAPISRSDVFAAFGISNQHYLPVVGVNDQGQALVLNEAGKLVLASKARVDGETFAGIVVR